MTMRLLLAIDDSENAHRAVRYVGSVLKDSPDVAVTLFHVLKPVPRALLEHGGSENPAIEAQLSARLRKDRDTWLRKQREAECPILLKACETLAQSGFDTSGVILQFGHEDDVAATILDEARSGQHDTVVMGRHGTSRITRMFGGGVTDRLLRNAKGFAIWIVE
jgi:nucleotide-binding universal stress UspA family protein